MGEQILRMMSKNIRDELKRSQYGKLMQNHYLFRQGYSAKFIENLVLRFQERTLAPEEVVYRQGEPSSDLFYLIKGTVQLFVDDSRGDHKVVQTISENNFFGDCEISDRSSRDVSCKSRDISTIAYLEYKHFIEPPLPFKVGSPSSL